MFDTRFRCGKSFNGYNNLETHMYTVQHSTHRPRRLSVTRETLTQGTGSSFVPTSTSAMLLSSNPSLFPGGPIDSVAGKPSNMIAPGLDGQYHCDFPGCAKKYKRIEHWRRHKVMHSGTRPWVCTYPNCSKGFTRADNLQQHMKSHTRLLQQLQQTAATVTMLPLQMPTLHHQSTAAVANHSQQHHHHHHHYQQQQQQQSMLNYQHQQQQQQQQQQYQLHQQDAGISIFDMVL